MNVLKLALAHLNFHWQRSLLLLGCVIISMLLPFLIPQLVQRIEQELFTRADSIPLVVGSANCSPLDMTLHGLYFRSEELPTINYGVWQKLAERFPESVVPLHARFHVSDSLHGEFPIVGTQLEYMDLQKLELEEGEWFATLGDCVLGAAVAQKLKIDVGGHVISSPKNIVSLAAAYPVRLNVVGILQPTGEVDDDIILVDVKTTWVIENLGHGHQDVSQSNDPNLVLERSETGTVASPAVVPYTEISSENLSSFHFHGQMDSFPITAILALTHDQRQLDLIAGMAEREKNLQAVESKSEVRKLLSVVFQIQWLLLAVVVIVGVATALLFSMVMALSIQIRKREMETMFKLGASRGLTLKLHASEIGILLGASTVFAWLISRIILNSVSSQWFHWML